jgi:hypothetical protein
MCRNIRMCFWLSLAYFPSKNEKVRPIACVCLFVCSCLYLNFWTRADFYETRCESSAVGGHSNFVLYPTASCNNMASNKPGSKRSSFVSKLEFLWTKIGAHVRNEIQMYNWWSNLQLRNWLENRNVEDGLIAYVPVFGWMSLVWMMVMSSWVG